MASKVLGQGDIGPFWGVIGNLREFYNDTTERSLLQVDISRSSFTFSA